jgi:hypothetical protein
MKLRVAVFVPIRDDAVHDQMVDLGQHNSLDTIVFDLRSRFGKWASITLDIEPEEKVEIEGRSDMPMCGRGLMIQVAKEISAMAPNKYNPIAIQTGGNVWCVSLNKNGKQYVWGDSATHWGADVSDVDAPDNSFAINTTLSSEEGTPVRVARAIVEMMDQQH